MQSHDRPIFTVKLTAPAYGGEALGRLPDGRVVFVPYAIPGETVSIQLVEEKRGHARGILVDVLEPSSDRVLAKCMHFGLCSNCHYQHIAYERQLELKSEIVRDQLERIGGLVEPQVRQCVASPHVLSYRNYIQLHLSESGKLGYYRSNNSGIFPIQECLLPLEAIANLWPQLDFESLAEIARVGLRQNDEDDIQVIIESLDLEPPEILIEDLPVSVIHLSEAGALVLAGSAHLRMQILEQVFQVAADSSFQVNNQVSARMVEHLLTHLQLRKDQTCLEIYCGVGLFSVFLAPHIGRMVAIEASTSACADFVENLDPFENVELYESQVGDILPHIQLEPDIILVEPPGEGIDRATMDALVRLKAPLLVYISCDPATLGRDARRLSAGGYVLQQVTPFDMLPQTYHVESISFWQYSRDQTPQ